MEITQGNGKSYAKHPTSMNLDTWIGTRGIHPLLATSGDTVYSAGSMPVSTTKPPPCTQHLLHPRNAQPHSTRSTSTPSPVTMQDATYLSSCHFNTNTTGPGMMSRSMKDTGLQSEDRSKFEVSYERYQSVDLKRRWAPASSDTALWVRVKQDVQMVPNLQSPGPRAKNVNPSSGTSAQTKQHNLSTIFQETSQAELYSKQQSNSQGSVKQVRSDLFGERHNVAGVSSADEATPAFMHYRNESASPLDHAMSKNHTSSVERRQAGSPDAELKRIGSVSSEEFVDLGRSLLRKYSSSPAVSKNLASERKRRKKLNNGLYSLRAMVPKISKMDKASIVGDAIDHVKELQQHIEAIETEIAEMESASKCSAVPVDEGNSGSDSGEPATATTVLPTEVVEASAKPVTLYDNTVTVASTADVTSPDSQENQSPGSDQKKILKMDVAKLEQQTYQLQISCQRAPRVLVQLTQALESLDLHVLNAYHTSFQGRILNTFIVEMKNLDSGEPEDVRILLLDAVAEHGFVSCIL